MQGDEQLSQGASTRTRKGIYYGHVIVLCSLIINTITFGVNYSFGIFFNPLSSEFGWTKAATSIAYSISMIFSGILGMLVGRISDSFGPRITTLVCGFFLALGCFMMSQITALWQLYLFFGIIIGAGVCGIFAPLMATVSRWYVFRRGTMTSIVAAGIGVGTMVVPLLAYQLLANFGWRTSFKYMSLLVVIFLIPSAFFLKRDPSAIGQLPYGAKKEIKENKPDKGNGLTFREAIHTSRFWIICAIYFSMGYGVQAVMVHLVPYATAIRISPTAAATIVSIVGLGGIIGRLALGVISDKIGIRISLILSLGIWLLGFLWLQLSADLWRLYIFGFVFGFAYGALIGLTVLVGANMFGLITLSTITAALILMYTAGGALGPAITGYIFDVTSSYGLAFIICLILALIGLILSLALKRKDWKDAG